MDSQYSPCKQLAFIDDKSCIGCSFCRSACPFDAIVGAPGYLYSVINGYCTGCGLCLAPCPVDCIYLEDNPSFDTGTREQRVEFARASKLRAKRLQRKLEVHAKQKQQQYDLQKQKAKHSAVDQLLSLKAKISDANDK